MQKIIIWQQGKLQADCSWEQLHTALPDHQAVIWLDIQADHTGIQKYTDQLTKEFHLQPLTIEKLEEDKERAKLISNHNYFYMVTHALRFDAQEIEAHTPKIDIIFGHNFLITIHPEQFDWLTELLAIVSKDDSEDNTIHQGMAYLLHAVLDELVDSYFPVLDEIDDTIHPRWTTIRALTSGLC